MIYKIGFNIHICDQEGQDLTDALYLSYNWSVFRDIFYIRDTEGKSGKQVSDMIIKSLEKLKEMVYVPNRYMRVDYYGNHKDDEIIRPWKMIEEYKSDLYSMFAWHLLQLLDAAQVYPDGRWDHI